MRSRHHSPSGMKLNSVGARLASGRISPEGSLREHGMYNSEYRSFNKRGFRRGSRKPYPPVPLSPGRGDIFMEAGRLAAEYLASQGLLSPNLLIGKQQNGNLKGQIGDLHEFRIQDRDSPVPPPEGRTSALARLGSMIPDKGSRRRRNLDEFNPVGSRSYGRGRKSSGNFRDYGSDWTRENRRNGPLPEKARTSPDMGEADNEFFGGYHEERKADLDVGGRVPKVIADDILSKKETAGDLKAKLENFELPDDSGFKASSSNTKRDLPIEEQLQLNKKLDDVKISNSMIEEVKGDRIRDEKTEKEKAPEDMAKQHLSVEEDDNKHVSDLLDLCSFMKVPTDTPSSLATSVLKVDQGPSIEESNMFNIAFTGGSKLSTGEGSVEGSSSTLLTNLIQSSTSFASDISRFPSVYSVGEARDLDPAIVGKSEICQRSQSFPDRSFFMPDQESSQPPGFERCRSMVESRGSVIQYPGTREGTKRPREWPLPMISQPDELICLQDLRAKQTCLRIEMISPDEEMANTVEKERLVEGALSPKGKADSGLESREGKQHLPSLFKICDLNLTDDASEIAESHEGLVQDHVSTSASALGVEKQASADVGLSICNSNFDSTHNHYGCSTDSKVVAGIDVTNGSVIEDNVFGTSQQKTEPIFSSMQSFLNHTENTVDLPDVRDGYSLGISELLGADISNCSSALPADVNDLQTGMVLHNQEGIPCEDDPIYLSLGEIPISFMGTWDQPSHDYGKPF